MAVHGHRLHRYAERLDARADLAEASQREDMDREAAAVDVLEKLKQHHLSAARRQAGNDDRNVHAGVASYWCKGLRLGPCVKVIQSAIFIFEATALDESDNEQKCEDRK